VNLLQPQDKKSKQPGDTVAAVAGRRRLHELGVTAPLFETIRAMSGATVHDVVLDVGCGEGFYLGGIAATSGCAGCGVDISIPAIDAAARKYPAAEWVVANADRAVPYADNAFSLVMSITARMNAPEFRRVLREDGRLLVAIPAPDDLIELRGAGRDRVERTVETFAHEFSLVEQDRVTTSAELDAAAVEDIRHAIYRPLQSAEAVAMHVTFSLDLLLFRLR
jgi:23S rRNA (guanine745-N1)-methyltransferase